MYRLLLGVLVLAMLLHAGALAQETSGLYLPLVLNSAAGTIPPVSQPSALPTSTPTGAPTRAPAPNPSSTPTPTTRPTSTPTPTTRPTSTPTPTTRPTSTPTPTTRPGCDASYPDVCIPPPPPDLNCTDIPYRNFTVLPPDPHRFDTDQDGIGCER